jgi:flagellin-like protein
LENYLKRRLSRNRVAVSELVGTLIMVAITLVAGAAAFGWVNGQASTSESAYGQNAAAGVNYLQEHFAPITSTFTGLGGVACSGTPDVCRIANFWIFNNGRVAFTLSTLQIQSAVGASNFLNIIYTSTSFTAYNSAGVSLGCTPNTPGFSVPSPNPVPIGTLSQSPYSVTVPTCAGNIVVGQGYVITMTGLYGNVVQFQVTANG